jgi:HD superfamily phosphohydrolase
MAKRLFEVRDAVHVFIAFDEDERRIIDSPAFQRLRHIHQLALTYNVYPGATHKRFEHSLGVMHLAGRVYDVITRPDKVSDAVRSVIPERSQSDFGYWRTVVRMAALCHDMGHLPFSHAAEDELLPAGIDHERITWDIVQSDAMRAIFSSITPPVRPKDVAKLAVGPGKAANMPVPVSFTDWEGILAEIIVGDAFGADRMDYLLRDSLHAGVAYGRFDHERLIGTLRVIPSPQREKGEDPATTPPVLGCERGGLLSAEQLLLARYFMFSQVYHHPARLAYNVHLKDFLKAWLGGTFPADVEGHLSRDDNDVLVAIQKAATDKDAPGHDPARRIVFRDHFKKAYTKTAEDTSADVQALAAAAAAKFGELLVAYGAPPSKKDPPDIAVLDDDGDSKSGRGLSDVMTKLPESPDEYVLADGEIRSDVRRWLESERERILGEARDQQIRQAEEEGR